MFFSCDFLFSENALLCIHREGNITDYRIQMVFFFFFFFFERVDGVSLNTGPFLFGLVEECVKHNSQYLTGDVSQEAEA